jgi:choline dehydrogenase-like flavoprotein
MKRAIVVGSGAGGATVAKELQGTFDVTILEEGKPYRPFTVDPPFIEKLKRAGLLLDERLIRLLYPAMRIRKSGGKMVMVNGVGTGGTTTICTGNALRQDQDLKAIGIDLDEEFDELSREVPLSDDHKRHWHEHTRQVYRLCVEMGLSPVATTKMAYRERCAACGRCIFGCVRGAKWDARQFVKLSVDRGAELVSGCKVTRVVIRNREVLGVEVSDGRRSGFHPADLVVLAAGGFGTPAILRDSGIECEDRLFVDPVLCVAARWEGAGQEKEIPMPFIVQRKHYIISPYFDFLSFYFNRDWRYSSGNIYSLMIKLADSAEGRVRGRKIRKRLSEVDKERFNEGVSLCREIFRRLGRKDDEIFLGTLNAGHPGGMLPLTAREAGSFHNDRLPENLYVADATLFPESLGNPPILTIMAMAKRVSKVCGKFA